jgi:hypothetical protein
MGVLDLFQVLQGLDVAVMKNGQVLMIWLWINTY